MSGTMVVGALLVALGAVLGWMLRRPANAHAIPQRSVEDPEALARAEREVQELDSDITPDQADDALPDWGPGAPKP